MNRKPFLTVISMTKSKPSEKKSPDFSKLLAMLIFIAFVVLNIVMSIGVKIGAEWAIGW